MSIPVPSPAIASDSLTTASGPVVEARTRARRFGEFPVVDRPAFIVSLSPVPRQASLADGMPEAARWFRSWFGEGQGR